MADGSCACMWQQVANKAYAAKGLEWDQGFTDRATSSVKMTSSLRPVTLSCVALGFSLASRKRACAHSKARMANEQ